jgi:hypothetical protein
MTGVALLEAGKAVDLVVEEGVEDTKLPPYSIILLNTQNIY